MAEKVLHAHEYEGKDSIRGFVDNPDDEYAVDAMDTAVRSNISWRQSRDGEERLHLHSVPIVHAPGAAKHGTGVTVVDPGDEGESREEERY